MPVSRMCAAVVASAVVAAVLSMPAVAEDTLKVAAGQRGSWETSVSELGQRAGIFKKHGLALDIVYTQGTGETQQAVISGGVDIGIAVGTFGAMSAYAKGAPIRVIGTTITGNDLYWYVKADSPIRSLKDAAGKTVAYSTNGSSSHQTVLAFAKFHHVDLKATATGSPPSTYTLVMSGQVDVGWAVTPFGIEPAEQGQIRFVAKGNDIPRFRDQTIRLVVTNADTLAARRPLLVRYMQAYRDTLEWMYSDPAALQVYAEFAQLPERVARRVRDEMNPKADLDPDRLSGLDTIGEDAITFKYLSAPLSREQMRELFHQPLR
jgi:NitT/TauT family transport system substrate-binding protein